jgi:MFS family permease
MRIGWIFKTESVIMPGFLLNLTLSGAIRGILPLISNVARSIPQFFLAHLISFRPRKKWIFFCVSLGLATPWGVIALLVAFFSWRKDLLLYGFLLAYGFNFVALGCVNLLGGTMQGKLIPARMRGRLVGISSFLGGIVASLAAYLLMPIWLAKGLNGYAFIFGTTSLLFTASAIAILPIVEWREKRRSEGRGVIPFVAGSLRLITTDVNFRRFMYAIWLLQMNAIIFPHYTAYGRAKIGVAPVNYMLFVVVQNLSTAVNSLLMGNLADRRGNRLALKLLISFIGCIPLVTLGIGSLPNAMSAKLFFLVYICIGVTPVTMKLTVNFLLELSPMRRHPQYLGAMNLFRMIPILFSPLIGWMIDLFSYEAVFLLASALIFCGAWMISRVDEPRLRAEGKDEG